MPKPLYIIIPAILISIGIGTYLATDDTDNDLPDNPETSAQSPNSHSSTQQNSSHPNNSQTPNKSQTTKKLQPAEYPASIAIILNTSSPAERAIKLQNLLNSIPKSDFPEFFDIYHKQYQAGLQHAEFDIVVRHWVSIDPENALNYMVKNHQPEVSGNALGKWLKLSEAEASAYIDRIDLTQIEKGKILSSAVQYSIGNSPDAAMVAFNLIENENQRSHTGARVALQLSMGGVDPAIKWMESLSKQDIHSTGIRAIKLLTRKDPEKLLKFADTNNIQPKDLAIGTPLKTLAISQPYKAKEYFEKQDAETQKILAPQYIAEYARVSPQAAREFVDTLGNSNKDNDARINYANQIKKTDINSAVAILTIASQSDDDAIAKKAFAALQEIENQK